MRAIQLFQNIARKAQGISLIEMAIGLMIFASVVFPLVVIPMRSMDQVELAKNTNVNSFESMDFLARFQKEINLSYRIYSPPGTYTTGLTFTDAEDGITRPVNQKIIFMAFWDNQTNTERRVGYAINPIPDSSPKKWQFLRAEIPANANPNDYIKKSGSNLVLDSKFWQPAGRAINSNDLFVSVKGTIPSGYKPDVRFSYCKNGICNTKTKSWAINPLEANAVKLEALYVQNGTFPDTPVANGLQFSYKTSPIVLPSIYTRVASLRSDSAQKAEQLMPFNMVVDDYTNSIPDTDSAIGGNQPASWLGDMSSSSSGAAARIPVAFKSQASPSSTWDYNRLVVSDLFFNSATNSLVFPTRSNSTNVNTGFFIFKSIRPGSEGFRPYTLIDDVTQDYSFPLTIRATDPALETILPLPATAGDTFESVIQDIDENTFVLFKHQAGIDNLHYVIRYSADGEYLSRFNLPDEFKSAPHLSLLYNTVTPEEIIIQKNDELFYFFKTFNTIVSPSEVTYNLKQTLNNFPLPDGTYEFSQTVGAETDNTNGNYILANNHSLYSYPISKLRTTAYTNGNFIKYIDKLYIFNETIGNYDLIDDVSGVAYDGFKNEIYLTTRGSHSPFQPGFFKLIPSLRFSPQY